MPPYDIKRVIVNSSMMELNLWDDNDRAQTKSFLKYDSNY